MESNTEISALGYIGIQSQRLEDWTGFATRLLGMQPVDRGGGTRAFRMDDRKQRIVIDRAQGEGTRFFGWEVADATALDALAARLEQAGVAVTAEPQALADNRRVRGLISFRDPAGNRLEAFMDTPWYINQPHRHDIDFSMSDEEIYTASEAHAKADPTFQPIEDWRAEFQKRIPAGG